MNLCIIGLSVDFNSQHIFLLSIWESLIVKNDLVYFFETIIFFEFFVLPKVWVQKIHFFSFDLSSLSTLFPIDVKLTVQLCL